MPEQILTPSGQRSAVLRQFDPLPNSLNCDHCLGLQPHSLRGNCCSYSGLLLPANFKEVDGKAQPIADGENAVISLTIPQGHAMSKPSEELRTSSMSKSPSSKRRRGRPFKILGKRSHASSSVAHHLVKSVKASGDLNRGCRTSLSSGVVECEKSQSIEPQSSTPRGPYQGVRERPGLKGCTAEIRPKRWKTTIWLGTYKCPPEAARAYDAGIFYTGKNIPFNFKDSRGSFPELPRHLSISSTDPVMIKEVKKFVKEQAHIASRRGNAQVQGSHLKCEHAGNRSMNVEGEDSVGTRSEVLGNPRILVHVKEEVSDGGQDQNEASPLETLDPVPAALQHCGVPAVDESSCSESLAPGCARIEISEADVNEGDPDPASEASQTAFISSWCDEEEGSTAADSLFKGPTSADDFSCHGENESLQNETAVSSQPHSWPFHPFELEVNDASALKEPACKWKGGSNSFLRTPRIPSFAIELPEDAMSMPQSWFETSIISDYLSDDYFNIEEVVLWPHMEGSMGG